ncbi:MAG TPA: PPOX class F420-dependent oxidoreductase [Acidimicrobiales bacterium]|nr:PPOX class F420-dependent oxidoreductase [Acidimicrobiales bacterium]
MAAPLTDDDRRLLEEPQIAAMATLNPDGSVQLTPTWVDTDGTALLVNTAKGRVKHRNLLRDDRVSLLVVDRADPDRWLAVRGRAELVDEGADEHNARLWHKYEGPDARPPSTPGEVRVIVRVVPDQRLSG